MKKTKIVLAALSFCLLTSASQALAVDVYGFGSYWEKDDVDGTWGSGVGVSLPIIIDNIRLDARAHYFESSEIEKENDTVRVIPVDLGAQVHLLPDGAFDPYVLGGISYNYIETEHVDWDSKFGSYLGAGLDLELGSPYLKLFGEVLYRFSDTENIDDKDFDAASGVTANIGLKIHLF